MKRLFSTFAVALAALMALAACSESAGQNDNVAVTEVTLDRNSCTIGIRDEITLVPAVVPEDATNKSVVWTSDNPTVATVNNAGLVTAVAEGSASIIVVTADGGQTAACEVTVVTISAESVSLNAETHTMHIGDTFELKAAVLPENTTDQNVIWSSGNEAVAIVENGLVTALLLGEVAITVTTVDGRHTATCIVSVTVEAPPYAKTDETWRIGDQIWSDAINDPGCNHSDFDTGDKQWITKSVCRNNLPGYGYLYTWDYVVQNEGTLCPNGWRVPTKDDFIALDIALGGTGANFQEDVTLRQAYIYVWGGQFGGYVSPEGNLVYQGELLNYWTKSEHTALYGYYLFATNVAVIYPQLWNHKNAGFTLRCVIQP